MSFLEANCPSCAAPIAFKSGSTIVLVCPYCRSAVARTDRGLEDLGKVADIAVSESPLKLGLRGHFRGERFELTGRAQNRHELGGFWDEWYATFSNGWVGWLAEAQGRFYLTFYQPLPDNAALPSFDELQVGQQVTSIPAEHPFIVQEKATATAVAADGEIPYRLIPGEQFRYADLAGRNNAFATIDYGSDPPWVFSGHQVTLADIGLADARPAEREARRVQASAMGCPNCGGPLELAAPDKTERVTCPNCSSLLDVNQGNLRFLKTLEGLPNQPEFVLQIGAEGVLAGGVKYRIIGATVRSVTFDQKYYWHEYLLYNPAVGFRWLVHSDNHWNFVEPVNTAEVEIVGEGKTRTAVHEGRTYRVFQDTWATVEFVMGEFYWRVEQGETVRAADFVSPPFMLTRESTETEVNWSKGTYLPREEVERVFGVRDLPRPWGVAPNQPFTGRFYYTWGALPLLLLFIIAIFMIPLAGLSSTALNQQMILPAMANPQSPQTAFSQPFELKGNRNVQITATAAVNNSWADLDVDLVNDQSQEVESLNIPVEQYSGTDSDGSWTEGSTQTAATLSSLPAGRYTLRVEGTWETWQNQMPVTVKVEQNVNRGVNFLCAIIVLSIVPLLGLIRKFTFESSRWRESQFATDE
jgi:Zn finger protein HypA/HybF involved in hydrogenase expression